MRPTASDVKPPVTERRRDVPRFDKASLTRAQAHAQRRCEPLTPAQFKFKGRLADQGINPLRER